MAAPERNLNTFSSSFISPELVSTMTASTSTPSSLPFSTTPHRVEEVPEREGGWEMERALLKDGLAWIATLKAMSKSITEKLERGKKR